MKIIFKQLLILTFGFVIISEIIACTSSRNSSVTPVASSATPVPAAGAAAENNRNAAPDALEAEKTKLEKERARLEKEKQDLKDEKAKAEKLQNASPPDSNVSAVAMTIDPPSNIRDSPNGKILCVVKKQGTLVKLYGSTDIADGNGEWFYTKHCGGKTGVIHSTQFVLPN